MLLKPYKEVIVTVILITSLASNVILGMYLTQLKLQIKERSLNADTAIQSSEGNDQKSDSSEMAQKKSDYYDYHSNHQYDERLSVFKMNSAETDVVFAGDSITQRMPVNELFPDIECLNRGIGSDVSAGLLHRMDEILQHKPKQVFIWIGINDIGKCIDPKETVENVLKCINLCKVSGATVYLLSVVPIAKTEKNTSNSDIKALNDAYKKACATEKTVFIDLYEDFLLDENSANPDNYGPDGVHLNAKGYMIVQEHLSKYIY